MVKKLMLDTDMNKMDKQKSGDVFLLATCGCCQQELLTNKNHLSFVLREIATGIGMKAISEPKITVATNNPGLEGYLPVDTSNITISTYTNESKIVACIHSCQNFDHTFVVDFLKKNYSAPLLKFFYLHEDQFPERL